MIPAMPKEKILFDVADLAQVLSMSDAAVRMHHHRRTGFLPEPLRTGTRRLYWSKEQLEAHFRAMTPPPSPPPATKKIGRPTKRQALAKSQQGNL
jgi:hypothetical protein